MSRCSWSPAPATGRTAVPSPRTLSCPPGSSVSFSKSQSRDFPDSETYRRAYGFAYDTEYPVAGCYGDYQDIFVGASGQDFCPYVFLLTTEGTVEYIDIFGGLWHGCLCSGGPLYGFRDIVDFESGVYEDGFGGGYETVYAVDKNGRKYDMPACITAQGNAIPSYAAGKWCANVCITAWPAVPPMRASTI